ncbi:IclR family transcriptional regulator C-terminal domain-containing protein [Arthrobacter sp. NA-172]|uniref:IclR family transcriptional regulator domain-containing protein n=1 Tax=Arthrobacter sp. NA-172 TaxID=3367524 RepID=UPI0037546D4B
MRHEGSAASKDTSGDRLRADRPKDLVQSLERGIAVLTAFDAGHPTMNLTEVAKRCGLPRSATRRFLHTLADLGYVTSHGRQYELTPQVLELGYSYLPKLSLADVARPHTEQLARALGASVSVAVLDGADVRYVHRVNAPSALAVSIRVGSRIAAHRTGLGQVLLASLPPEKLAVYLEDSRHASGAHHLGPAEREQLTHVLDATRKQGWGYVDQLLDVGVRAVAVPLHSRDGSVIAALSASLHSAAIPEKAMIAEFLPRLQECAARISLELRSGIES